MHSDDDKGSENDMGPDLPSGVLRSRGGWDDRNNLELEHQRERLRAAGTDDPDADAATRARGEAPSHAAAVDLSQFRNEEVGKGYQAKHVVRQKAAAATALGVVDMTGGEFSKRKRGSASSSVVRKRRCSEDDKDGKKRTAGIEDVRLESYLKCKGLRDFMKEIDEILNR